MQVKGGSGRLSEGLIGVVNRGDIYKNEISMDGKSKADRRRRDAGDLAKNCARSVRHFLNASPQPGRAIRPSFAPSLCNSPNFVKLVFPLDE